MSTQNRIRDGNDTLVVLKQVDSVAGSFSFSQINCKNRKTNEFQFYSKFRHANYNGTSLKVRGFFTFEMKLTRS